MSTEHTSLKNTTPAGDSNTTNEMVIGKINTYKHTFLILAGSLLSLLVLIAVAGTSDGQHLTSSEAEIAQGGAGTLAEYQADTTNSALVQDIFGLDGHSCDNCLPPPTGAWLYCHGFLNCPTKCCNYCCPCSSF